MITAVELISGDYFALSPGYKKLRKCPVANFCIDHRKSFKFATNFFKSLQHTVNSHKLGVEKGCFPQERSVRDRIQASLDPR